MTVNEFIVAIESYYDLKYKSANDLEIKFIQSYLKPKDLEWLFLETIKTHSKKWKTLPDISIFNAIEKERKKLDIDRDAEKAWLELLGVSSGDDVLIGDSKIFQCVACYGSWWRFCEERDHNREWTHKDFIKRYHAVSENSLDISPKVLYGEIRKALGHDAIGIHIRNICGEYVQVENKMPDGLLNFVRRVENE